jgi:hypothetical protein
VSSPFYWNTKITKRDPHRDVLVCHDPSCNKFGAVGGRFNRVLLLAVPVDERLIEEMLRGCDGTTSEQIMVEVCVNVAGVHDRISKWLRRVGRKKFDDVSID